jgi:hypothetical protein
VSDLRGRNRNPGEDAYDRPCARAEGAEGGSKDCYLGAEATDSASERRGFDAPRVNRVGDERRYRDRRGSRGGDDPGLLGIDEAEGDGAGAQDGNEGKEDGADGGLRGLLAREEDLSDVVGSFWRGHGTFSFSFRGVAAGSHDPVRRRSGYKLHRCRSALGSADRSLDASSPLVFEARQTPAQLRKGRGGACLSAQRGAMARKEGREAL